MLHFCCAENIVAMVLRYLPKFSSTSLEALLVEESIQKKKGRKSQYLFTAQLLGKWKRFSASPNLFYCSQKPKKNYGAGTHWCGCGVGVAKECPLCWQGRLPRIARPTTKYGRVKPRFDKSFWKKWYVSQLFRHHSLFQEIHCLMWWSLVIIA